MALINDQNRKWIILVAASCAFGLIMLDETVVAVALPTIQRDLSMSLVLSHWVINSYLLVIAGFIAVGGQRVISSATESYLLQVFWYSAFSLWLQVLLNQLSGYWLQELFKDSGLP